MFPGWVFSLLPAFLAALIVARPFRGPRAYLFLWLLLGGVLWFGAARPYYLPGF